MRPHERSFAAGSLPPEKKCLLEPVSGEGRGHGRPQRRRAWLRVMAVSVWQVLSAPAGGGEKNLGTYLDYAKNNAADVLSGRQNPTPSESFDP
ncbi:hypothetical protein [Desulfosarcina alkanivorans]|nr:hypothetical protein [Desulfosarcina alkanivorans]